MRAVVPAATARLLRPGVLTPLPQAVAAQRGRPSPAPAFGLYHGVPRGHGDLETSSRRTRAVEADEITASGLPGGGWRMVTRIVRLKLGAAWQRLGAWIAEQVRRPAPTSGRSTSEPSRTWTPAIRTELNGGG
ncbi:hypothetical protein HBB16_07405 [Pseudonocardia sp. MCCB 268]|nr:hypothetical protein [Pseudonocardia cytotoxica]